MSIRAISWVFDQDIPSSRKFVLLALADNASAYGEAWPSVKTIARKTNLERKTIIRALNQLEADGILSDTGRRVGETKQIKVYRIDGWDERVPKAALLQSEGLKGTIQARKGTIHDRERVPSTPALYKKEPSEEEPSEPSLVRKKKSKFPVAEIFDYWNSSEALPRILHMEKSRMSLVRTRLKEPFFHANWREGIDRVRASNWCTGGNSTGWRADFDWFLKAGNLSKIIEGRYDNKGKENGAHRKNTTESGRGLGTANEGRSAQYEGVGKVL